MSPTQDGGPANGKPTGSLQPGDPREEARLRQRRRRSKNIALFLVLVAFAVLIYIVSIVRMSGA